MRRPRVSRGHLVGSVTVGLVSLLIVVTLVIVAVLVVVTMVDRESQPVTTDGVVSATEASVDAPRNAASRVRDDVGVVGIGISGAPHCSGVPLRGTGFVVTATHCLMVHTTHGTRLPRRVLVVRKGRLIASATAATVDPRYLLEADSSFDVSVVETDTVFDIGVDGYGAAGDDPVDVLGLQHARTEGDGADSAVVRVFGCRNAALGPEDRSTFVVACELGRGASGGPVVVRRPRADADDELVLVGVVSAFDETQTHNRVSPVADRLDELFGPDSLGVRVVFNEGSASDDDRAAGLDGPDRLVRRMRHGDPLGALRISP